MSVIDSRYNQNDYMNCPSNVVKLQLWMNYMYFKDRNLFAELTHLILISYANTCLAPKGIKALKKMCFNSLHHN